MYPRRVPRAVFCGGGTQWVVLSAAAAKSRARNASEGPERRPLHAPRPPQAVGGTPPAPDWSTEGTLNMGTWAGTGGALAWVIVSDVPSTSSGHGSNSGAHGEPYSKQTHTH